MDEILIVDDQQYVRELLSDCLKSDYTCILASSAEEAKALLAASAFKVVLTDIEMPGASGLELLAHITNSHHNTIVVIISAAVDSANEAASLGAFDFITKPFDLTLVRESVERAFEHWVRSTARSRPLPDT